MKYILVTGGVLSGIGKGVIASSTGVLMKSLGYRVTSVKIDPYINIDAGTMSPFEHGEVFVLDDGGEVDLDLGNYERFIDSTLTRDNNITTGKIYNHVIEKERVGGYLGKTVQVVPHICNAIQDWVERVSVIPVDGSNNTPDICIIELGGTVGDIESMPFIEAMRQFQFRVGKGNFCLFHVSLVPTVGKSQELKTKPTQQSVRELRALGLTPDAIFCRSASPLPAHVKEKISLFCHVPEANVISVYDVSNIYRVPLILDPQGVHNIIYSALQLMPRTPKEDALKEWSKLAESYDRLHNEAIPPVHIAVVGKYTELDDAYHSISSALQHASLRSDQRLVIDWVEASNLEENVEREDPESYHKAWDYVKKANGILVPGGFGDRGVEGKILAAQYCRTSKKPYLGICLGLQIMAVEVCRNVLGWKDANSTEFSAETSHPVVINMPEISKTHMGGTMRLGKRDKTSTLRKLYGDVDEIDERHRHRYEVNPDLVPEIESKSNLRFVAQDETGKRMEIAEMLEHPYMVAVQYHPEFKSRPLRPSPPFVGLILAAAGKFQ
ncbi:hypothetical protein PROFUN_14297 [Planoprotostelium fungivorum]|uniref:CTP synthase n=1 Tax=Planoprotostelium fungivorum TaxID=1890364 RepID=A0A2P6N0J1_9EUKA|nr:hypothetical protein PROFUN_14297 [Planoprotostelium fungivorum]